MFEIRYLFNPFPMKVVLPWLMFLVLTACGGGSGGGEKSPSSGGDSGSNDLSEAEQSVKSGEALYAAQCASCHGQDGHAPGNLGLTTLTYSESHLTGVISDTMPPSKASTCVDDCASDIAAFIMVSFLGKPIEDEENKEDDEEDEPTPRDLNSFYSELIETDIVQAKCALCHNGDDIARDTNLILNKGENYAQDNLAAFSKYYTEQDNAHATILSKVRGGAAHGGGIQLACDEQAFKHFEDFLQLLNPQDSPGDLACSGDLFEEISLISARETLRRAAVIMAGRLPTDEEYELAETNTASLRGAIRNLMQGENFHEFLVRGANDRLLTEAMTGDGDLKFADRHDVHYPELSNRSYEANVAERAGDENAGPEFINLLGGFRYAGAMAPLKLIAHIVENDLPYTEILTADYTMVNPQSNIILNSGVEFDDTSDLTTFKPGQNQGQIFENSETTVIREDKALGPQVVTHGGFIDYPHAGLLNDIAILNRYPSTDTNRNRGRARFSFYQFLNYDIEKSAARTTDPEDLADTNNPTLNNPACTVCHTTMDPVAGAFQNYDDSGHYRGANGGLHSLPTSYTKIEDTLFQEGDLWYRDMLPPGFGDEGLITERDNSLQVLAQRFIADERFAQSAVVFWWPALMATPLEEAPEQITDSDYQAKLSIYEAQQETVVELAEQFVTGFNGGSAYNLKDLLVEMVMSHWFRAESTNSTLNNEQEISLANIGIGRLLTPEELALKTKTLTGTAWGELWEESRYDPRYDNLKNKFTTYYGGIDSFGITSRATDLTALMSNVALAQALEMSCPIAVTDLRRDTEDRLIFKNVNAHITPLTDALVVFDISNESSAEVLTGELVASQSGAMSVRFSIENPNGKREATSRRIFIDKFELKASNGVSVISMEGEDLRRQRCRFRW